MSFLRHIRRPPLSGRVNFTWNLAGKTAYAASRAFLLVLIAKLQTPEAVGQYSLALAVTAPVFMLADLDLRSVLATDAKGQYGLGHYLGLRLLTTLLAFAAVSILALCRPDPQTGLVLLFVGLAKSFEAAADMLYGLLQREERLDKLGVSLILKSVLSALLAGILMWYFKSLAMGAAGLAAAFMLVLLFYDIPAARPYARIRPVVNARICWRLTRLCLPLGAVLLFISLGRNMPHYFIEYFWGSDTLGYFASILYIVTTGSLMISALGQSNNARLARLFSRKDLRGFVRILGNMLLLTGLMSLCMTAGAALFGGRMLALLYRPEYAAFSKLFVLVMVAGGISYIGEILQFALTATRRFNVQPFAYGGVLLAGLVINGLAVPAWGLEGACRGLIATSFLQTCVNLVVLIRILRKEKSEKPIPHFTCAKEPAHDRLCAKRVSFPQSDSAFILDWKALLTACGSQTAFADPDWLIAYCLECGDSFEPFVLAVYDDKRLVAVFPFMLTRRLWHRECRFMGHPYAACMDIAVRPGYTSAAADAVLCALEGLKTPIIFDFTGLDGDSAVFSELERRACKARLKLKSSVLLPVLHIDKRPFDTFYRERFSRHAVRNGRRNEKRLAAEGRVTVRQMTARDLAAAFELHRSRWRKKLDTSGFDSDMSRRFFSRLTAMAPDRWRVLALGLYLDDRLISFQYGFVCGGRASLYRSAHNDILSIYAPGKIIKREYIRRCFEDGLCAVDFGIGYEEYKLEWTQGREMVAGLSFPGRGLASFALFLPFYLKGVLRSRVKQSRRMVLFKRNSLGRLRYALTGEAIRHVYERASARIAGQGLSGALKEMLHLRRRRLLYRTSHKALPPAGSGVRQAKLSDTHMLALLFSCPPEDIVRRFYGQRRGFVVERQGAAVCAAFMTEDKKCVLIEDFRTDRRFCQKEDAALLMARMLNEAARGGCTGIALALFQDDRTGLAAALEAGFCKAARTPPPPEKSAAVKGMICHANPDYP